MGQLKASEVRLLIIFLATVVLLGTFFGYEWYAKALQQVKAQKVDLQAQRQSLLQMKTQEIEFNQKRDWLNKNQPIARDEFEAKENLDRILDVRGIEASGLTLISSPPEKAPSRETYYWAFERRVVVAGSIENIVQWLTQLQSESAFRVITHMHLFPKKKKEPENLTCEVTIEQRYATEEILAMSNVTLKPVGAPVPVIDPVPALNTPDVVPTGASVSANKPGDAAKPAGANEANTPTQRPRAAVKPPTFNTSKPATTSPPAGGADGKPPARPRVRLPNAKPAALPAGGENETSLVRGSNRASFASVDGRVIRGGPTPPPLMAGDNPGGVGEVSTGVELVPDAIDEAVPVVARPVTSTRADNGVPADAPDIARPFDSINPNAIAGLPWDETSPGAGLDNVTEEGPGIGETPQTN